MKQIREHSVPFFFKIQFVCLGKSKWTGGKEAQIITASCEIRGLAGLVRILADWYHSYPPPPRSPLMETGRWGGPPLSMGNKRPFFFAHPSTYRLCAFVCVYMSMCVHVFTFLLWYDFKPVEKIKRMVQRTPSTLLPDSSTVNILHYLFSFCLYLKDYRWTLSPGK